MRLTGSINSLKMRRNAQKLQDQSQVTKNSSGLGSPKHVGAAFAHTGIQKQKSVNTPLLFKRIRGKCYTHNVQLRGFYRKVFTKCTSDRRQTYVDSIIYYEITCRASRVIRICKLEVFQQNGRTYEFCSYVFSVFCKYLRRTIRCLVLIGSLNKVIPNFSYCNCHPRQFASQL